MSKCHTDTYIDYFTEKWQSALNYWDDFSVTGIRLHCFGLQVISSSYTILSLELQIPYGYPSLLIR